LGEASDQPLAEPNLALERAILQFSGKRYCLGVILGLKPFGEGDVSSTI